MSHWRPPAVPRSIVQLGIRKLALDDRVRYREEVWAELYGLPVGRQRVVALSFWRGSNALRRACEAGVTEGFLAPGKDWRCRLHRHRMVWIRDVEPPHASYQECVRCGKFFDVPYHAPSGLVG